MIHVFIGAGPANLDRALKIAETQPEAQIVIIDSRLTNSPVDSNIKIFNRDQSRANIFFFNQTTANDIKNRLTQYGIHENELKNAMYQRNFGLEKHHLPGQSFFMIQIRDLQNLFIRALHYIFNSKPNQLILLSQNITTDENQMTFEVMEVLEKNNLLHPTSKVKIHSATGAFRATTKNSIVYPPQFSAPNHITSPDVEAMPIIPLHVTGTFNIHELSISCESLEKNQQALVNTNWRTPLAKYNWTLVRPPSVRVFYSDDILYIGAEYPASILNEKNVEKRRLLATGYLQQILNLMFPNVPIEALTTNQGTGVEFETLRGEHGQFEMKTPLFDNVSILRHGDARYLPHYQTASGFVIAQAQNDLYVQIQIHQTFDTLYAWAKQKKLITNKTQAQVYEKYSKLLGTDTDKILDAFKLELFNAGARDIIDENKLRVGTYFSALHKEERDALIQNLPELLSTYNRYHGTSLNLTRLSQLPKPMIVIQLLESKNIAFLKVIIPQILNIDIRSLNDEEIYKIRDIHINNYLRVSQVEDKQIHTDTLTAHLIHLSNHSSDSLIPIMKNIASSLIQNKTLHHRAAISFFKGVHSDAIHQFAKNIDEVIQFTQKGSSIKQDLLDLLQDFHDQLKKGKSVRTIRALEKAIEDYSNAKTHDLNI